MAQQNQPQQGNQVNAGQGAAQGQQAGNAQGSIADILALIRDRITQLNWLQFFQLIQQLIALFKGGVTAGQAGAGAAAQKFAGCDAGDCCKAHFTAIREIAACGEECCDCHPDL